MLYPDSGDGWPASTPVAAGRKITSKIGLDWHFCSVLRYFWERFVHGTLSGVQKEFFRVIALYREFVRSGWIPALQVESLLPVGETVYPAHL